MRKGEIRRMLKEELWLHIRGKQFQLDMKNFYQVHPPAKGSPPRPHMADNGCSRTTRRDEGQQAIGQGALRDSPAAGYTT